MGSDKTLQICESLNNMFEIDGETFSLKGGDYTIESIPTVRSTPCVYKGLKFESMTEAAIHFDTSVSAVSQYVKRTCHRYECPVEYKGKIYACLKEAAQQTGDRYQSVAQWVHRHNSYIQ